MLNLLPLIEDEIRKKKLANQMGVDDVSMNTYAPSTDAFDQIKNTLSNLPERDPNPSFMKKLGGSIVGMGAGLHPLAVVGGQPIGASFDPEASNKATDMFVNRPYYEGMDDITKRIKLQEPLLNAENEQNRSKLSMFNSEENRRIQNRAQDRLELQRQDAVKKAEAIDEDRDADRAIREKAQSLKEFLATRQEWKTTTDKNGKLVAYNSKDPKESFDTGIDTGKLNDIDKMNYRHSLTMSEIEKRGDEARITKETPSASSAVSNMSPTQKKADIQNKLKEASETHPEWNPYISIHPETKQFQIDLNKIKDKSTLAKVAQFVYGEEMVRVKSPQGVTGWLKKSQLNDAKVKGFTTIDEEKK